MNEIERFREKLKEIKDADFPGENVDLSNSRREEMIRRKEERAGRLPNNTDEKGDS